jgi:hypothetical protein
MMSWEFLAIVVVVLAGAVALVWIALKRLGITIPDWFQNVCWVVVVVLVVVFAIKLIFGAISLPIKLRAQTGIGQVEYRESTSLVQYKRILRNIESSREARKARASAEFHELLNKVIQKHDRH